MRTVTGEIEPGASATRRSRRSRDGELDVVLTTPEFLHLHAARFAESGRVGFLVVDEAHHVGMSRAGHRPAYARLGEALEALGGPTVLAVTATADDATADDDPRDARHHARRCSTRRCATTCAIEDRRDVADKDGYLASLAARGREDRRLRELARAVGASSRGMLRKRVPELAMRTAFYNGGLSRSARHAVERAFRDGERRRSWSRRARSARASTSPTSATSSLYHLPFNEVEFNQMSGRAGRDGALARIHLALRRQGRAHQRDDPRVARARAETTWPRSTSCCATSRHAEGAGFEITNAELAERAKRAAASSSRSTSAGVSSALGVFRDLGLRRRARVTARTGGSRSLPGAGQGRPRVVASRYAEGLDEIAEFAEFKAWALDAPSPTSCSRGSTGRSCPTSVVTADARHPLEREPRRATLARHDPRRRRTSMPATLEQIEAQVRAYNPDADLTGLDEAYDVRRRSAHEGQMRKSGEPFVNHPIEVALILAELHMDTATLKAALLHDVVEDSEVTLDEIRERFGDEVAELVDGVTKLGKIEFESLAEAQSQQPAQDAHRDGQGHPRHPHQARRPPAQHAHARGASAGAARIDKARETMEIYAPLAHRLGISQHQVGARGPRVLLPRAGQVPPGLSGWSPRAARRARTTSQQVIDQLDERARRRSASTRDDLRAAQAPLQHLPEDDAARVRTSTRSTTSSRCA